MEWEGMFASFVERRDGFYLLQTSGRQGPSLPPSVFQMGLVQLREEVAKGTQGTRGKESDTRWINVVVKPNA